MEELSGEGRARSGVVWLERASRSWCGCSVAVRGADAVEGWNGEGKGWW